jgi:hypothetical protein
LYEICVFVHQNISEIDLVLTVGVTRAATLQPNLAKIDLPISIINKVTVPVTEEKFPMKAE